MSDYSLRIRDLTTGKDVMRQEGSQFASSVTFSPDGRLVAWTGFRLLVWEVGRPKPIASPEGFVQQGCFSPDGQFFVTVSTNETLRRWETDHWRELRSAWGGRREDFGIDLWPTGCIAYHPSGKFVAAGCDEQVGARRWDSLIQLIDAETRTVLSTLRCARYVRPPSRLAFSPNGGVLAVLYGPRLRIWDAGSGAEIASLQPSCKHFNDVAFTPEGRRLVTVSNDALVRLWDVDSWSEAAGFEWQIGKLGAVAVAPDGLLMAAGGHTGHIVVWDVDS